MGPHDFTLRSHAARHDPTFYERDLSLSKKPPAEGRVADSSSTARRARRARGDVAIPEREQILDTLREQGVPMHADELAKLLRVSGDAEREAFDGRLAAMERDGQLMTNRKAQLCVVAKLDLISGTVQGQPDGFGFLVPEGGGPELFLSPKEMH